MCSHFNFPLPSLQILELPSVFLFSPAAPAFLFMTPSFLFLFLVFFFLSLSSFFSIPRPTPNGSTSVVPRGFSHSPFRDMRSINEHLCRRPSLSQHSGFAPFHTTLWPKDPSLYIFLSAPLKIQAPYCLLSLFIAAPGPLSGRTRKLKAQRRQSKRPPRVRASKPGCGWPKVRRIRCVGS